MLTDKTQTIDQPAIKIVASRDGTLACLSGRLDIDSSPAVRNQLLALVQAADSKIVSIDLSAVTHIDSSGVATLIDALGAARASNTD